jgi:hypothetical protein
MDDSTSGTFWVCTDGQCRDVGVVVYTVDKQYSIAVVIKYANILSLHARSGFSQICYS